MDILQICRLDMEGNYLKCILASVYGIKEKYNLYILESLKGKLKEAIELASFCKNE
jgi:hypothetical protein